MKTSLRWIAAFSVATNLLLLVPPLYMLQLYDRVLSTRSVETLIYISLIALVAMALFAAAEAVRSRLAQAAAARFADTLGERLFVSLSRTGPSQANDPAARMADFDTVRGFLASRTFLAVFDLPFAPVFLLALALLHPLIGFVALMGCGLLALAALGERRATKAEADRCRARDRAVAQFGQTTLARSHEMRALGLFTALRARWRHVLVEAVNARTDHAAAASLWAGLAKFVRKALQIFIMGSAAWLVVQGSITGGVIFAASMLTARALAPIEALIAGWDTLFAARAAHARVAAAADDVPSVPALALPPLTGRLALDRVSLVRGSRRLLDDVSLSVAPGEAVCVRGASGAGKSLLLRLATGALAPDAGTVCVDGVSRGQWPDEAWAAGVGSMPQDVVLFPGTVAENVSRFDARSGREIDEGLRAAAEVAGALSLVRALPQGFATPLGPGAEVELSSGERALVALARALYTKPRLLVLDEPFAHLDEAGERRLLRTLERARKAGCAILVASNAHRLADFADRVVTLDAGRIPEEPERAGERQRERVAPPPLVPDTLVSGDACEDRTARSSIERTPA